MIYTAIFYGLSSSFRSPLRTTNKWKPFMQHLKLHRTMEVDRNQFDQTRYIKTTTGRSIYDIWRLTTLISIQYSMIGHRYQRRQLTYVVGQSQTGRRRWTWGLEARNVIGRRQEKKNKRIKITIRQTSSYPRCYGCIPAGCAANAKGLYSTRKVVGGRWSDGRPETLRTWSQEHYRQRLRVNLYK